MNKMCIIEDLQKSCKNKMITRNCNRILKKFSVKSSKDIGNMVELVVLLYIFDMRAEAIKVCSIMDDIEFTGNYTIWDQIMHARFVVAKIFEEEGLNLESVDIVNKHSQYIFKDLYNNKVETLLDFDKKIEYEKSLGSKSGIRACKLMKLELLIYDSMLPDYPLDKLVMDEEIAKLKAELKEMIK